MLYGCLLRVFVFRSGQRLMPVKRNKLDDSFSQAVRASHDYTCQRCGMFIVEGDRQNCHLSHFKGRSNLRLRHDTDNAACLCGACHHHLGGHPDEHTAWFKGMYGERRLEILNEKYNDHRMNMTKITKADKEDMHKHYKSELKRIRGMRAEGVTGVIDIVNYW